MPNILAFEPQYLLAAQLMDGLKELNPHGTNRHAKYKNDIIAHLHAGWPTDLIILGHREDELLDLANSGELTYAAIRIGTPYQRSPIIGASFNKGTFAAADQDANFHFLSYLKNPGTNHPYWNLPDLGDLIANLSP